MIDIGNLDEGAAFKLDLASAQVLRMERSGRKRYKMMIYTLFIKYGSA